MSRKTKPQSTQAASGHTATARLARALADRLAGGFDTFNGFLDLEEMAEQDRNDNGHARVVTASRASYQIDDEEYSRLFDYVGRTRKADTKLDRFMSMVETDNTAHIGGRLLGRFCDGSTDLRRCAMKAAKKLAGKATPEALAAQIVDESLALSAEAISQTIAEAELNVPNVNRAMRALHAAVANRRGVREPKTGDRTEQLKAILSPDAWRIFLQYEEEKSLANSLSNEVEYLIGVQVGKRLAGGAQ